MKVEGGKLLAYWFSGNWKFDDPTHLGPSDASMQPHFLHESHPIVGSNYLPRKAFDWKTFHTGGGGTYINVHFCGLPLWLPTALFAIPILLWAIYSLLRRRRVSRQGFDVLPRSA